MKTLKNGEYLFSDSPSNLLGKGAYAQVFRGINSKMSNQEVAIKRIEKRKIDQQEKLIQGIKTEILIMTRSDLEHTHLIRLFHVEEDEEFYFLVLELCKTDVATVIRSRREKLLSQTTPYVATPAPCIPEKVAGFFFVQLTCGLFQLHQKNLLHRDLKPENLLIKEELSENFENYENCVIKLADFGFSKNLDENSNFGLSFCGTPLYMSPECINGAPYGKKADIWALGCILYEMITGVPPFSNYSKNSILFPPYISEDCKSLITNLLNPQESLRYDLKEIVQHPFFLKNFEIYEKISNSGEKLQKNSKSVKKAENYSAEFIPQKNLNLNPFPLPFLRNPANFPTITQNEIDFELERIKQSENQIQQKKMKLKEEIHQKLMQE